jgi:hypothetical protein
MSNPLRAFKRKETKRSFKEAEKVVKNTNMQKRRYDEAFRQFRERWKEAVRNNVNPRWPKLSRYIPPEKYFNFMKGLCEKIYGEISIANLLLFARDHKWPKWRVKVNELPRRFVAWILFYLTLKWLMVIHTKLITFGIKNKITHDKENGVLKQTIKFHGKVIEEIEVRYGSAH